jgi:hypothetical protein
MRRFSLAALLILAIGCDSRGFLRVTVENLPPNTDQIDITVTEGNQIASHSIKLGAVGSTFDFSLSFESDRLGPVEVKIDAVKFNQVVAQGSATGNLVPGQTTDVTVTLPGPVYTDLCSCYPFDMTTEPPSDLTTPPDLLPPGFDPTGLQAWFRADKGIFTMMDSDGVFQWEDSSGHLRHASQAGVDAQPHWIPNVLNGQPVVRLTNGQYMTFDGKFLLGSDYSLVIVEARAKGNDGFIFAGGTSVTNQGIGIAYAADTTLRLSQWNNDLDMTIQKFTAPQFAITMGVFDHTFGHLLYRDGQPQVGNPDKTPIGGTALDQIYIGGFIFNFYSGDIAELMIFDIAISDAQRTSIDDYLKQKYGL